MTRLWACIDPTRPQARILITHGAGQPLLKANLSRYPQHRQALPRLLEAIATWEGMPIHAALVADAQDPSALDRYHDSFFDGGRSPLYTLDLVSPLSKVRRQYRDDVRGMGSMNDLRQLLLFTVAR